MDAIFILVAAPRPVDHRNSLVLGLLIKLGRASYQTRYIHDSISAGRLGDPEVQTRIFDYLACIEAGETIGLDGHRELDDVPMSEVLALVSRSNVCDTSSAGPDELSWLVSLHELRKALIMTARAGSITADYDLDGCHVSQIGNIRHVNGMNHFYSWISQGLTVSAEDCRLGYTLGQRAFIVSALASFKLSAGSLDNWNQVSTELLRLNKCVDGFSGDVGESEQINRGIAEGPTSKLRPNSDLSLTTNAILRRYFAIKPPPKTEAPPTHIRASMIRSASTVLFNTR